jgi:hypothetical protein
MPGWKRAHKGPTPTGAEFRALNQVRLEALDVATAQGRLDGPLPVTERWGWHCRTVTHSRDAQGNLLASVEVYDPNDVLVYSRNVRLINAAPLPYDLGKE